MKSIKAFERSFPVRTFYSDRKDWQQDPNWMDIHTRDAILRSFVKVPVKQILYAPETHSGSIVSVCREGDSPRFEYTEESRILGPPGGYDSAITNLPGVLLCIWTSDCLPLYLYDRKKHVAAISHCGWRGICSGIVANTLLAMTRRCGTDPADVQTAFGPCICGKCYEVGEELKDDFSDRFSFEEMDGFFKAGKNGKWMLDIKKAVTRELIRSGIPKTSIYDTHICSYESEEYSSMRRDGPAGKAMQTLSGIVLV